MSIHRIIMIFTLAIVFWI